MLDLNLNVVWSESDQHDDSWMGVDKFPPGSGKQMDESGTSNSSIVNADEDSCSTRASGEAFTFSFDILKGGGKSAKTDELFGGGGNLGQRSKWIDLSFDGTGSDNQAAHGGSGEVQVTQQQSQPVKKSRRGPRSKSSQYRGVTFYRRTGRWESHIWDSGKQVYLGGFDTAHAAARAYDRAAIKFRGVDADINFTIGDYEEELKQTENMTKEEFVHILRRHSTGFARGSSRYRGVTLHKCGRWEARMGQFLGKKAYDKAAIRCNGREAVTNFEPSTYEGELIAEACNEVKEHDLDLNLGISPPSFGDSPKEGQVSLHYHSAPLDVHSSKSSKMVNLAASMASNSPSKGIAMSSENSPSWNGVYPGFFSNYEVGRRGTENSNWSGDEVGTSHLQLLSSAASSGFSFPAAINAPSGPHTVSNAYLRTSSIRPYFTSPAVAPTYIQQPQYFYQMKPPPRQ